MHYQHLLFHPFPPSMSNSNSVCPTHLHPRSRPNPCKPNADLLSSASSALVQELERFKDAYEALMNPCADCVADERLNHYLHCQEELRRVNRAFDEARRELREDVEDEKRVRGM